MFKIRDAESKFSKFQEDLGIDFYSYKAYEGD